MNRLPFELLELIATMIPPDTLFDLTDFPLIFYTVRNSFKFEKLLLRHLDVYQEYPAITNNTYWLTICNESMVNLTNDLLDFSRGKIPFEHFDNFTKFFLLFENAYVSFIGQKKRRWS